MCARPAKPLQLHLLNGNKRHLTKDEIAARQKQETKLRSGIKAYKPGPQVKNDLVAHAMFKKLQKLYKGIEFVEGLDENIINRYCLLHSEYTKLRDMRQDMTGRYVEAGPEERLDMVDTMLDIDRRIDKKMDLLLKLEDRLFLNPTARIKNVPRSQEKPREDPNADLFD